jgi:hypothetical protein
MSFALPHTTCVGAPPELFGPAAATAFLGNPNVQVVVMGSDADMHHATAYTDFVGAAVRQQCPAACSTYRGTRCDWCGARIDTLGLRLRDGTWGSHLLPDMCFKCAAAETETKTREETAAECGAGAGAGAGVGVFDFFDTDNLRGLELRYVGGNMYADGDTTPCTACSGSLTLHPVRVHNSNGSKFCLPCMSKWANALPSNPVRYMSAPPALPPPVFAARAGSYAPDDDDGGVDEVKEGEA